MFIDVFGIASISFILLLIDDLRLLIQFNIRQSFFPQSFAAAFLPNNFIAKVFYCTVEPSYDEAMNHLPFSSSKQSHVFLLVVSHFVPT